MNIKLFALSLIAVICPAQQMTPEQARAAGLGPPVPGYYVDAHGHIIKGELPNNEVKKVAPLSELFASNLINKTSWQNIFGQQLNGKVLWVEPTKVCFRIGFNEYPYELQKLSAADQNIVKEFYTSYTKEKLSRFKLIVLPEGEYLNAGRWLSNIKQLVADKKYSEVDKVVAAAFKELKDADEQNSTMNKTNSSVYQKVATKIFSDEKVLRGFIIPALKELNNVRIELK